MANTLLDIERIEFYWSRALYFIFVHLSLPIGIYKVYSENVKGLTIFWGILLYAITAFSVGPGAHRYFTHRTYKATDSFKNFMIFGYQLSGLPSLVYYVRNHRAHHKYVDTDADPTNINRGFFYAYCGFLLMPHTREAQKAMDNIYMDDILADKWIALHDKYWYYSHIPTLYVFPILVPYLFWNESIYMAFWVNMIRFSILGIQQSFGSSILHMRGWKPYDKSNSSVDSAYLQILTLDEGNHNFHHAFPRDYRGSEHYKMYQIHQAGIILIDFFSLFGWIYDKNVINADVILRRAARTGDGSHCMLQDENSKEIWKNNGKDINDNEGLKYELH